jgi:hypothetical protein
LEEERFMRLHFDRAPRLVFLVALAPGLGGCPGTLNDPAEFEDASGSHLVDASPPAEEGTGLPPPGDGGCPTAPSAIFTPMCATSECHSATFRQSGLDLASPIDLAALVNQPTVEADGGFLLINAANPLESALYTKLGTNPPFPVQMPYGMTPLSAEQIQCVGEWITAQVRTMDAGGE